MQTVATLLAGIIPALALGWAVITYSDKKRGALALERTKFIFDNLQYLETDPSMQKANKIVYRLSHGFTIEDFLLIMKGRSGTQEQTDACMAIENYLNLLWRVGYAHITLKTIERNDLDAFGYYFYEISKNVKLMEYCNEEGYEEIVDAIDVLRPIWKKAEAEIPGRLRQLQSGVIKTGD